jgi:curved DNA-binding protein CbpA
MRSPNSCGTIGNDNHFEVLEVKKDCTAAEVKAAYLRLAKVHHPDLNSHPEAAKRFQRISLAYEVLKDDVKRAQYRGDILYSNVQVDSTHSSIRQTSHFHGQRNFRNPFWSQWHTPRSRSRLSSSFGRLVLLPILGVGTLLFLILRRNKRNKDSRNSSVQSSISMYASKRNERNRGRYG